MASASSKEALTGAKGIIDKPSNHSVDETVEKLKNVLQSKGVTLFELVDHSGEGCDRITCNHRAEVAQW